MDRAPEWGFRFFGPRRGLPVLGMREEWAAGPFFIGGGMSAGRQADMAAARDRLVEMLDPVVTGMGFEMVDLEVNAGRSGGLLRVFIDSAAGITLDDCEAVSRRIGSVLDVVDPMGGRYTLEVSSPGLDRRLVRPEHFDRFRGAEVTIKLRRLVDGRRKVRGTLVGRDEDMIEVFTEGSAFRIPLAEVDVARLVPDFKGPARQG